MNLNIYDIQIEGNKVIVLYRYLFDINKLPGNIPYIYFEDKDKVNLIHEIKQRIEWERRND